MAKGTLALRQIQLGDNADTSKNFVISVPAVADGTLVIKRGNGTDVLSIDASGDVSIPNLNPQTWQSMFGSRALNTVYTNTTSQPITVSVICSSTIKAEIRIQCQGVSVFGGTAAIGDFSATSAVIPAGASYQVTMNGTPTLGAWAELR